MSMIPPGPYLESTTPPWSRLQRSGHFVGFKRSVGKTQLFSEDGYAWSGSPIDYDKALRETGLKDAQAQRVFHGDLVSIRLSSGEQCHTSRLTELQSRFARFVPKNRFNGHNIWTKHLNLSHQPLMDCRQPLLHWL